MSVMNRRLVPLPLLLITITACNKMYTTTDVQMSHMDAGKHGYGDCFSIMVDNAILSDMCVADIHFVPHTAEISGIGEARLNRIANLVNTYGGTVRYETLESDDALIEQRLDHVREYLELCGCDMSRVQVAAMISGGRGMPGDEAVRVYSKGTKKEEGAGGMTLGPAVMGASQGK